MKSFSLHGRNAVVTGGSRGIGRAIALRLAEVGTNVALSYRERADEAHQVAREIEENGRLAVPLQMDVTDRASVDAAATLKSPLRCAQAFLPLLAETRNGETVHIGSIDNGGPSTAPYAAGKAGLIALGEMIARLGAPLNVRSNVVDAGFIASDTQVPSVNAVESILLKRLDTARGVVDAGVFLASDAAAYSTGQTLNINGGLYS